MARPLRIEYEGAFYHVTARGNERKRIYYDKADYGKFKEYLKKAETKYGCLLHCYVLMPNHYHLILETPQGNLSSVMQYVNGSYTTYINTKKRRSGHLFQGRYKSIVVDRDSYLLELSRYVHLNPVRAALAARPEEYPYSSYRAYIFEERDEMVSHDLILDMISHTRRDAADAYRDFVDSAIGAGGESPLRNVYGGMILGNTGFVAEVLSRLENHDLDKEDISHRRELKAGDPPEKIIDSVCLSLGIPRDALPQTRQYRDTAIYLIKKHTGLTNDQVGKLLGDMSYSAVAKACQRFSEKVGKDAELQRVIEEIMSNVKA